MKKKMIKNLFFCFFIFINMLNAEEIDNTIEQPLEEFDHQEPSVDCLILEDENSIICKFEIGRNTIDKQIQIQWINPNNELSRQRNMIIPAGHGSIYDYRYIKGREFGVWKFKVIIENKTYSTNFELK